MKCKYMEYKVNLPRFFFKHIANFCEMKKFKHLSGI